MGATPQRPLCFMLACALFSLRFHKVCNRREPQACRPYFGLFIGVVPSCQDLGQLAEFSGRSIFVPALIEMKLHNFSPWQHDVKTPRVIQKIILGFLVPPSRRLGGSDLSSIAGRHELIELIRSYERASLRIDRHSVLVTKCAVFI